MIREREAPCGSVEDDDKAVSYLTHSHCGRVNFPSVCGTTKYKKSADHEQVVSASLLLERSLSSFLSLSMFSQQQQLKNRVATSAYVWGER